MKKFMMAALITMTGLMLMPNAHAAVLKEHPDSDQYGPYIGYSGSHVKVEQKDDGVYEVTLEDDAKQDLVILKGETAVLNLNTHKLENYVNGQGTSATIWIQQGGKLTIKGTGTVGQQTNTANMSVIANDGELIIEEGVTVVDGGRHETTAAPTIGNNGTLKINGGTVSTKTQNGAAIFNYHLGKLEIDNVTIKNDTAFTSGITNEGSAIINGGTYTQGNGYSIVLNRGRFTINDGTFNTTDDFEDSALITNEGEDSDVTKLTVNDGTFTSNYMVASQNDDTILINGGDFSTVEGLDKYLADNLTFDKEGNIVEKPKPTVKPVAKEENPDTSDNASLLFGLLVLGACGLGLTTKKRLS